MRRGLAYEVARIEIVDARDVEHARDRTRARPRLRPRVRIPFCFGLVDLARDVVGFDLAGAARVEDAALERLHLLGDLDRLLQQAELVAGLDGLVDAVRKPLARRPSG